MNIISRKFLSIVLIATLIFATNTFVSYGADVTDKLVNLDIIVEQGGEIVDSGQGDKINSNQPIDIEVSFQVPVIGDGVEDYVELNDEASFQIAEGFQLIGGDVSFDLEVDTTKVGTLSLTSEAGSIIMAHVSFNGNPDVFTDSGDNWSNVNVRFTKSLEYDGDNFGDEEGDHQVALLEKTFTVNVPPLPIVVSGEKTGVRTGQYIDWKVGIEAKQGEENVDLSGYVFSDDITNVGTYESGTFEVGTAEDGTDAVALTTDFLETDTELTYTFPENTIQKQYIFFRTRIKDTVFYTNGNKTITNEAVVNNGNEDVFSEEYDVDFNVTWIQKNVVSHNDETGEVIWSITANQLGATLPNAIITDDLDDRLDNVSATLQKWDSGIEDWGAEETITQNGDDFELGTIDTPVLLKITAYIDTDEYNIGHTIQTIGNTASLSWDGQGPIPGNNTNVGIG
ncbi:MAG TPA: hypothetical protein VJ916_02370, partial [Anaerovoracaceae bacterium]|nr:hypothetical protein [Anaerovoracaceae bacterium]